MPRTAKVTEESPEFGAVQYAWNLREVAQTTVEERVRKAVQEELAGYDERVKKAIQAFHEAGGSVYVLQKAVGITSFYKARDLLAESLGGSLTADQPLVEVGVPDFTVETVDDSLDRTHRVILGHDYIYLNYTDGDLYNGEDDDGFYKDGLEILDLADILGEVEDELTRMDGE